MSADDVLVRLEREAWVGTGSGSDDRRGRNLRGRLGLSLPGVAHQRAGGERGAGKRRGEETHQVRVQGGSWRAIMTSPMAAECGGVSRYSSTG